MTRVTDFLAKYRITTHGIAAVIAFCVAAYYQYPPFQQLVLSTYGHFPMWAKQIITVTILLWNLYRNGTAQWKPGDVDRRNESNDKANSAKGGV